MPLNILSEPGRERIGSQPTTEEQRDTWSRSLQSGFFDPQPYLEPPYRDDCFKDVWFSDLGLNPYYHIPGIPKVYEIEWAEGRTVYLWGVPNFVVNETMIESLKDYGTITKLPTIIDFITKQTFRFVIMSTHEEAKVVVKLFHLAKIPFPEGSHGVLIGTPALAPHRGLIKDFHVATQNFDLFGGERQPIFGYQQELGPGRNPTRQPPVRPYFDIFSRPSRFAQTFKNRGNSSSRAPRSNGRDLYGGPPLQPGSSFFQTPTQLKAPRNLGYSNTPSLVLHDTPTPEGFGSSLQTPIFETPSKVGKKIDIKGKGKEMEMTPDVARARPGRPSIAIGSQDETKAAVYNQNRQADGLVFGQYGNIGSPFPHASPVSMPSRPRNSDRLLTLLRKNVGSSKKPVAIADSGVVKAAQPVPAVPAVSTPARKVSNTMIAVPDLDDVKTFEQRGRAASTTAGATTPKATSKATPKATPKAVQAEAILAATETLPTIVEKPKIPELKPEHKPESKQPGPVAKPAAPSSWAAVAGTLPAGHNVIDVQPTKPTQLSRLKTLTRIPAGPNPSKNEPLTEQMRVVFLLDIPTTLGLSDISSAIHEGGSLRSIHFGIDEEKGSRFCAVVFQNASNAAKFTNILLKERADSRPCRFKFIVDVVRGEDPYPLDDILRAMEPPTNATRRLTLVRACFFNANSKRMLRQKIENIVGESTIQLIWLYNAGNATIVFSDVGSAIAVKDTFNRWADDQEMEWVGLQTTFSKDPCVQTLGLASACPVEWNK